MLYRQISEIDLPDRPKTDHDRVVVLCGRQTIPMDYSTPVPESHLTTSHCRRTSQATV
jgi:hypothetical protein